jgi:hypothetical protein
MKISWTIKNVTVLSLMIATIICLLSGCSKAQQISANNKPLPSERKILTVYLSRTNNTKAIAEFNHQKVGGTMVALELETPYPADYNATSKATESLPQLRHTRKQIMQLMRIMQKVKMPFLAGFGKKRENRQSKKVVRVPPLRHQQSQNP